MWMGKCRSDALVSPEAFPGPVSTQPQNRTASGGSGVATAEAGQDLDAAAANDDTARLPPRATNMCPLTTSEPAALPEETLRRPPCSVAPKSMPPLKPVCVTRRADAPIQTDGSTGVRAPPQRVNARHGADCG